MANTDLTAEKLREILHYSPEEGVFTWLKPTSNRVRVGQRAGNVASHGYIDIGLLGRHYYGHRLAWLYIYGVWPANEIDHKDRNGLNNRIENLREATHKQNMENRRLGTNNSTGFRGVHWHKKNKNWVATIRANGITEHLGSFSSVEDAVAARAAKAREVFTHATID